jgi:hypothetical protein
VFVSVYTGLRVYELYQMHVRTSGTTVHNFLQNLEVVPYHISLRDRVCFLKIAACKSVEVITGVSCAVHDAQNCCRCDRKTKGLPGVFTDLFRRFQQSTLHTIHKFSFRVSRHNLSAMLPATSKNVALLAPRTAFLSASYK